MTIWISGPTRDKIKGEYRAKDVRNQIELDAFTQITSYTNIVEAG